MKPHEPKTRDKTRAKKGDNQVFLWNIIENNYYDNIDICEMHCFSLGVHLPVRIIPVRQCAAC
jgi:hypothetical protein